MKKIFTLTAVLLASVSAFAFQPGMATRDLDTEVRTRAGKGESLATIASAAKAAGMCSKALTSSLILAGNSSSAVVSALTLAGCSASETVNDAVSLGGDRATLNQVAIAAGADPTSLLAATAAGGQDGTVTPAATGLNAAGFGQSRAATVGGGGRSSVSGS